MNAGSGAGGEEGVRVAAAHAAGDAHQAEQTLGGCLGGILAGVFGLGGLALEAFFVQAVLLHLAMQTAQADAATVRRYADVAGAILKLLRDELLFFFVEPARQRGRS